MEQIIGRTTGVRLTATRSPIFMPAPKEAEKPKEFILPSKNHSSDHMLNYLQKRGIDIDILRFCMDTGRLYESHPYHNAVFVGMDEKGTPRYAALRGENFMGEAAGSDKHYSFGISTEKAKDVLHLFESPIDLLSYASLLKLFGHDWRLDHLLSLSGVYRPKENAKESSTPAALERFLENNPNVRTIVLRFDNDQTGRLAVQTIKAVLPNKYRIISKPPSSGKDYNDFLCDRLGLSRAKPRERER